MSTPPDSPDFRARGGGWVVVQFILMTAWIAVPPRAGEYSAGFSTWSAAVLLAGGAGAGIAGVAALKGNRTPFPRPRAGSQLITGGIYRFVRHPLYLSLMLLATGWALLWQSPAGGLLAVLQAVFFDAKARCEERFLTAQFPDYAGYAQRTARFFPGLY